MYSCSLVKSQPAVFEKSAPLISASVKSASVNETDTSLVFVKLASVKLACQNTDPLKFAFDRLAFVNVVLSKFILPVTPEKLVFSNFAKLKRAFCIFEFEKSAPFICVDSIQVPERSAFLKFAFIAVMLFKFALVKFAFSNVASVKFAS